MAACDQLALRELANDFAEREIRPAAWEYDREGTWPSISCNGLASAPVVLGGSEQIKKTFLGMLVEAPKLASFGLTEPDAGSEVSRMRTHAVSQIQRLVIARETLLSRHVEPLAGVAA